MTHLTSTNQAAVITAEAQICTNCGLPNNSGTSKWSEVSQDANGLWYIAAPTGWGGFTQEQMMVGVIGVAVEDITIE